MFDSNCSFYSNRSNYLQHEDKLKKLKDFVKRPFSNMRYHLESASSGRYTHELQTCDFEPSTNNSDSLLGKDVVKYKKGPRKIPKKPQKSRRRSKREYVKESISSESILTGFKDVIDLCGLLHKYDDNVNNITMQPTNLRKNFDQSYETMILATSTPQKSKSRVVDDTMYHTARDDSTLNEQYITAHDDEHDSHSSSHESSGKHKKEKVNKATYSSGSQKSSGNFGTYVKPENQSGNKSIKKENISYEKPSTKGTKKENISFEKTDTKGIKKENISYEKPSTKGIKKENISFEKPSTKGIKKENISFEKTSTQGIKKENISFEKPSTKGIKKENSSFEKTSMKGIKKENTKGVKKENSSFENTSTKGSKHNSSDSSNQSIKQEKGNRNKKKKQKSHKTRVNKTHDISGLPSVWCDRDPCGIDKCCGKSDSSMPCVRFKDPDGTGYCYRYKCKSVNSSLSAQCFPPMTIGVCNVSCKKCVSVGTKTDKRGINSECNCHGDGSNIRCKRSSLLGTDVVCNPDYVFPPDAYKEKKIKRSKTAMPPMVQHVVGVCTDGKCGFGRVLDVKYAIVKISRFKDFCIYEVMKPFPKKPKKTPNCVVEIFVTKVENVK